MCKTSWLLMPCDSWAPPPMCLPSVWSWHHLISPAFPLCICMLQVIKDWRWEWPENEANWIPLGALKKAHVIGCYWGNTKYSLLYQCLFNLKKEQSAVLRPLSLLWESWLPTEPIQYQSRSQTGFGTWWVEHEVFDCSVAHILQRMLWVLHLSVASTYLGRYYL